MATRDRSQGFGFIYVDINKLIENIKAGKTTPAKVINFNKDSSVVDVKRPEAAPIVKSERQGILDRLDALQDRLQKMLKDMEEPPPLLPQGGKKK